MKKAKRRVGTMLLTVGCLMMCPISVQAAKASGPAAEIEMASKWIQDESGWHFTNEDGTGYVQSQWVLYKDKWYYCDENGTMKTGKLEYNGVLYYLNDDGDMVCNEERVIDGVTYQFDASGAGTAEWPYAKKPRVIPADSEKSDLLKQVDAASDAILAQIINDQMNQRQKATAIYNWIKGNLRYSGHSTIGDWEGAAWDGIRKRHGDCYTYASLSSEMLNRAGMRTIEIIRSTDNDHYWNLVEIDGNWYHFDPCPRRTGGDFCLLTNAQIAYSSAHIFDHSLYPPTP